MMSLLLERDRQLESAFEILDRLSEILEQQYEESEDPYILQKFCIVKSDIGRMSLGLGEFEAAVENSSTALDLSQDLDGLEKARLSSQITVGLGHYFLQQFEDAIDVFQTVLAESDEDVDVMLLVARALWAVGGDQERQVAIQQIQDWYVQTVQSNSSLSKDPQHVGSFVSLGAVGVLTNDQQAMRQAEMGLRSRRTTTKQDGYIRRVLMQISECQERDIDDVSRAGIMSNPSSAREWTNLSRGGDAAAQLALRLAQRDHTMETEELSATYERSGSLGGVQAGILLSPWRIQGWQKLGSFN